MRKTILIIVTAVSCLVTRPAPATEANEVMRPFVGVRVIHSKSMEPRQVDMWIVEIDPKAPGVSFLVTPSNGELMGDTTPVTTREFVTKVGAQLGVNGSFFKFAGKGQYDVSGLSVSKGNVYSTFNPGYVDAINISRDGVATVIRATAKEKKSSTRKVSLRNEAKS